MSQPIARWVVQGRIRLTSAARLGAGDSDLVDHAVGLDELTGRPLLPGTTLAGLLRSHVAASHRGHFTREQAGDPSERLFGIVRASTGEAGQSAAIVFDAVADTTADGRSPVLEIRDGVAINHAAGTAEDHKKFDFEVIPAGVTFPVRVDLLVRSGQDEHELVAWLARALDGLGEGGIRLGGKTSRGMGAVESDSWRATRFDLGSAEGWMKWLGSNHEGLAGAGVDTVVGALSSAAGQPVAAAGRAATPVATFSLKLRFDEPLLIGSPGSRADDPDEVHLMSGGEPILSGPSVAGVLRHRAWTIAEFVAGDGPAADSLVDWLFGPRLDEPERADPDGELSTAGNQRPLPRQSRLHVSERPLDGGRLERRTRVALDRLTGGVLDGFLFDQQPIVGAEVTLDLQVLAGRLDDQAQAAIGLMVLVCRDVVEGYVSFGGSEAIGHGYAVGEGVIFLDQDPGSPDSTPIDLGGDEADELVALLLAKQEVARV